MQLFRTTTAGILALSLHAHAATAPHIAPLRDSELVLSEAPVLERAGVPELARLAMRPSRPSLVPHLRSNGDVETLAQPLTLRPSAAAAAEPEVLGRIVVDGAASLRVRVTGATPGTTLWLAGEAGEFERFSPGPDATWSPTVPGPVIYVAARGPAEPFEIAQLAIGARNASTAGSSCIRDVACVDAPAEAVDAGRAIAMIRFIRDGASYVCTGALLNDSASSGTPYFLTAHHCISTAEAAASIEAVWDDRSPACNVAPAASQTRTYGAVLLMSSAETDVALLRLNRVPPGRTFLGVEDEPVPAGTATYRLSHADGAPQSFSAGVVRSDGAGCASAPRPHYLYTAPTAGAVTSGSSGAPLLVAGLRVAGQLTGRCGATADDPCATYNDSVDGAISGSWPLLAPFLDPPPTARKRAARH
jgi:lysyl endopeptidase